MYKKTDQSSQQPTDIYNTGKMVRQTDDNPNKPRKNRQQHPKLAHLRSFHGWHG